MFMLVTTRYWLVCGPRYVHVSYHRYWLVCGLVYVHVSYHRYWLVCGLVYGLFYFLTLNCWLYYDRPIRPKQCELQWTFNLMLQTFHTIWRMFEMVEMSGIIVLFQCRNSAYMTECSLLLRLQ
jgi:hypothetical protein